MCKFKINIQIKIIFNEKTIYIKVIAIKDELKRNNALPETILAIASCWPSRNDLNPNTFSSFLT